MGWKNAEIENTIFGTIDWGMSAAGLTFRSQGPRHQSCQQQQRKSAQASVGFKIGFLSLSIVLDKS